MGLVSDNPSRSRFHWDLKSPPWTDGKGNQEQFYNAVLLWKDFHDCLPEGNSKKIPSNLQGIMLQSQLFGRALELVKQVDGELIRSDEGAMAIARAMHKQDPLSVISDTYQKSSQLLQTTRGDQESFKNFESRFQAQVCRCNATSSSVKLPESLVAFVLLNNSRAENNQRVSILAAAVPKQSQTSSHSECSSVLESLKYQDVATVLRASDKARYFEHSGNSQQRSVLSASSAQNARRGLSRRPKLSAY